MKKVLQISTFCYTCYKKNHSNQMSEYNFLIIQHFKANCLGSCLFSPQQYSTSPTTSNISSIEKYPAFHFVCGRESIHLQCDKLRHSGSRGVFEYRKKVWLGKSKVTLVEINFPHSFFHSLEPIFLLSSKNIHC